MICKEGKVALWGFLLSAFFICLIFLPNIIYHMVPNMYGAIFWGPVLYFIFINIVLKIIFKYNSYQIAVRAAFLGFVFSLGIYIWFLASSSIRPFGLYISVLSCFHFSEYISIAIANPKTLSLDTFMLNHSPQYVIAAVASWVEFFIETYFWPSLKTFHTVSLIGLVVCFAGELIRKIGILTASSNFNHLVQCQKSEGHVLVTHGIFRLCRHPSYVGWFYWAIGTQIIQINPICLIIYIGASWMFFNERIIIEELSLLNFFGQEYYDYQQKVPTGLPFIEGYKIEL